MANRKPRTAAQRITRARAALMIFQPFYGTILYNLTMVESYKFPTMATDGRTIHYNPDFVDSLTDDELLFVLAHEAAHCANKHHLRRGNRDHAIWNEAGDYVINGDLILAAIGKMPKDGLYDRKYAGLASEDIYNILTQPQEGQGEGPGGQGQGQEPQDGPSGPMGTSPGQDTGKGEEGTGEAAGQPEGQPQDGSETGAGQGQGQDDGQDGEPASSGDSGGCGEVLDAPGDAQEIAEQTAHWETVVRQAVNVATKEAGHVPAHLQRLVTELGKPETNWREALRRFVEQSNRFDYSWQRCDRRFSTADFLMPGTVTDGVNHVIVVSDTSGSLYAERPQKRFATEIQSLLDENVVDKITLIDCDAAINNVQTFESGDIVKFTNRGGGGTSFKPVWQWLKDNQEDAAALIYFTDLEPCDGFGDEPALPVLWAAYGDPRVVRQHMQAVPFGECIEIGK